MADKNERELLQEALQTTIKTHFDGLNGIEDLRRLSGGASQEIWSFVATGPGDKRDPLILRRAPGGVAVSYTPSKLRLDSEAQMLRQVEEAGVPVPSVRHIAQPEDNIGAGYIMEFIEGETIARKILREDAFAEIRPKLARQCGEILARIHALPTENFKNHELASGPDQLQRYWSSYEEYDYPHPVFETAFRYLKERMKPCATPRLIHGDFRNGNLIITPDGVRAVLDWELSHLGDPMEDISWICVPSWRYGNIEKPVGGFGEREDLFAGYESAGGAPVDPEQVKTWEIFGALKWGIMCMSMYSAFKNGPDRSVERAAIGRRSSETQIDILKMLFEE